MSREETTSLLVRSDSFSNGYSNSSSNDRSGRSIVANRVLVIASLALLVALAIGFQIEVHDLSTQLDQEKAQTQDMRHTIQSHERVIERFNASVTNTDVVTRLEALQADLVLTKHTLSQSLETTQTEIGRELNDTLQELSHTVAAAEAQITQEVDRVKTDVEQYVRTTQDQFSMENSFMVYQLAGTFTLLACLISMWHMTAHLRKMNQPDVQRRILSILWMAPIYAITSWFSLVFHSAEGYLAIVKDGYEAYIIYQFLSFCIAVLGKGDRDVVVDMLARRSDHLTPPIRLCAFCELCMPYCCRRPYQYESSRALANAILLQCQAFALQFVFFRPLTTTAMVVLNKMHYYGLGDGPTDYRSPQFYLVLVQNLSIFTAFAGLLKFYHAVDKDLSWCRPFAKFLCIKGVVFMTFWQGLALSILAETTDVGGGKDDAEEWAKSAQNFLICLEMLLFSIAHFYCFPTDEWEDGYRVRHSQGKFGDSIALGDFFADIKLILKSNNNHQSSKSKSVSSQETIAEEEDEPAAVAQVSSSARKPKKVAKLSEEEQAERALVVALEKSLGVAGNDPDIIEAKQRLLESGILSADYFDDANVDLSDELSTYSQDEAGDSSYSEDLSDDPSLSDNGDNDDDNVQPTTEANTQNIDIESQNADTSDQVDSAQGETEATVRAEESFVNSATATTSATMSADNGTSFSEILRPSFFTTVASLATDDGEKEGDTPASTNSYGSTK